MKRVRGYIFSRPFMGERVPQHVQNLVIRDYCERNNFFYLLSVSEYAMEDCHLIFEQLLDELHELDGIVLYSLFQLPTSYTQRNSVYSRILELKKTLHFSVEGFHMSSEQDCERVETLWRIRQTLPDCIQFICDKRFHA
jgi:sporadic carbohydrate cluster protein (TIGR04323 family)